MSGSPARWRPLLALALVVFALIVIGSVVAFKTPAFEANDEPGHVENIETLVEGHWYHIPTDCRYVLNKVYVLLHCAGTEPQQAPLYYLLFAGWQTVWGVKAQPPFKGDVNRAVFYHSPQIFEHKSTAIPFYLLLLRLPNIVLGAFTIILSFFVARRLTDDRWTPVIAAALVGFLPRMIFLSSFVTNDNLVTFLGAVLAYVALRHVLSPSRWWMAAAGAACGLLVATKLSTLPMLGMLVLLAAFASTWVRKIMNFVLGTGAMLVVCGWYLVQNQVRYGDPLARHATTTYLAKVGGLGPLKGTLYRVTDPLGLVFVQVPERIVQSFWFQAGWGSFSWPAPVNIAFCVVAGSALLGLIGSKVSRQVLLTLGAMSALALVCVWAVALQTETYEARYALVGLTAMAVLTALGLERWRLPVRFAVPLVGLCGTLVALQMDVLGFHWT